METKNDGAENPDRADMEWDGGGERKEKASDETAQVRWKAEYLFLKGDYP